MNSRSREGFYTIWTIAILLCLAVCIFLLIWASFTDGGEVAQVPEQYVQQDGTPQDAAQSDAAQQGEASADGQQPVLPGQDLPAAGEGDGQTGGETAPAVSEEPAAPAPEAGGAVELGETEDMGMDYQNRLIFLGDSTTYGLYAYGVLPHYQVWTPASGTMSLFNYAVETIDYYTPGGGDSSQSLPIVDCAANSQPEFVVITLGLNGISILDETQFKQYYASLIQDLRYASPNTRIICNSIYPVIDAKTTDDIKNDKINAANGWILDVATEAGVKYLNTHDALTDGSGNLSSQYIDAESDGIHMNADGYNAILQYIRTHAWQ